MELNFNSVEMSRKPNAEASSLGYAEVPLTFNSVETIPNLKASAAFQVDSGKVFKEDVDMVPTIIDKSLSYMPWGGDNEMPFNIIDLIESDETLSTCQQFNAEVCYISGLKYDTEACTATVKQQVEDFLLDNALPSYFLGVCQDFKQLDNLLTLGIAQASLALHSLNRRFDSDTKEGGDWSTDIQEAVNMFCFTMRVHSNLVGSVPGKSQTNNSGSDKRELYTIAHSLQKPYHDLLFTVHRMIIRFNG